MCSRCWLTAIGSTAAAATVAASVWIVRLPHTPKQPVSVDPPAMREPKVFNAPQDQACLRRRAELLQKPALPGTPELEAARAEITARARSAPVLFVERPQPAPMPPEVAALRARLFQLAAPWRAFHQAYVAYRRDPRVLRQIVLTDGYLYAERPELAALLGNSVLLTHLFNDKELTVTRGANVMHAVKQRLDYVWKDGSDAGRVARLWLFDRVGASGVPEGPALHISLDQLRKQAGADRIEVVRLTSEGVVAQLIYAEARVPAVLRVTHGRLELECEAIDPQQLHSVNVAKTLAARKQRVMEKLRQSIDEQVSEALPFDEPKSEEGQQDGKLRLKWRDAYLQGRSSFTFNGDEYSVFGAHGRPRIPQVCVNFVVDTWERMAGTHWLNRNEGRKRQVGRIDFNSLEIENRRSVDRLIEFARNRPDWFDVIEFSDAERIPFYDRKRFFQHLFQMHRDFQPGDVVAILGLRDDERMHYHSFIVVTDDPLTGMPTAVAANAGRPRIRNWEAEMQNAPRRSIIARIRPRLEWLEALAGISEPNMNDVPVELSKHAAVDPTGDRREAVGN